MNRAIGAGTLLMVLSLVACGNSGKGETGGTATESVEDKHLKDLTSSEAQAVCDSLANQLVISKEDACEFAGVVAASAGQTCDKVKDQCMKAPDTSTRQSSTNCMPPAAQLTSCTITVAEFKQCLEAQAAVIRSLTCQSSAKALEALPPACEVAKTSCPQVLGDGGQPSSQ